MSVTWSALVQLITTTRSRLVQKVASPSRTVASARKIAMYALLDAILSFQVFKPSEPPRVKVR